MTIARVSCTVISGTRAGRQSMYVGTIEDGTYSYCYWLLQLGKDGAHMAPRSLDNNARCVRPSWAARTARWDGSASSCTPVGGWVLGTASAC